MEKICLKIWRDPITVLEELKRMKDEYEKQGYETQQLGNILQLNLIDGVVEIWWENGQFFQEVKRKRNRQCIKECPSSDVPAELEKIFDSYKGDVFNPLRRLNSVFVECGRGVSWFYWEDGSIYNEILTYDQYMDMRFIRDFVKEDWQAEFYPGGTTWDENAELKKKKQAEMRKTEEAATVRPHNISLNLSDADLRRLDEKAQAIGVTMEQLLENFIRDLTEGTCYKKSLDSEGGYHIKNWFENHRGN